MKQFLLVALLLLSFVLGVGFTPQSKASTSNSLTGSWSIKAGMPTAREGLAAGAVGSKVYAIKGYTFFDTGINQAYDTVADSWTTLATSPIVTSELGGTAVGTSIYAIGGRSSSTVDVYNTQANSWLTASPMPTPRRGVAAVAVGTTIYAIGGSAGTVPGSLPVLAANEAYDTPTNTWRILAPMPTPRSDARAVALSGKIYVIGGTGGSLNGTIPLSTIEAYDISTNSWSELAPMPTPRSHVVAGVCGNSIFVIGGAMAPLFTATGIVEAYTIGTNSWAAGLPPMPTPRWEMAAAQVGNTVYAVGGGGFGNVIRNSDGTGPNEAFTMTCPQLQNTSLRVSPIVSAAPKGGTFSLSLNVVNVTNLVSFHVFLTFDPSLLAASTPADSGNVLRNYCSVTTGCLGVSSQLTAGLGFVEGNEALLGSIPGFSGSGLLYTLIFTVSKSSTGTSVIHISSSSTGTGNGDLGDSMGQAVSHFSVDGVFSNDKPDLFVSIVPNILTLQQGGQGSSQVSLFPLNGLTGTATVTVSGAPFNVSAFLSQTTLVLAGNGTSTTLRISAGSPTFGNFTLTVTATVGSGSTAIVRSSLLQLTIQPLPPDFSLSLASSTISVPLGGSGAVNITLSSIRGFNVPVKLALSGLFQGQGVSDSFTVNPVTPPSGGQSSSSLVFFVSPILFPQVFHLIILASGGGLLRSASLTLVVSAFELDPFPFFVTLQPGSSATDFIAVRGINNFTGTVQLSTLNVPSDVSASLSSAAVTLGPSSQMGSSTLLVSASANVSPGTVVMFVIGISGRTFSATGVGLALTDFSITPGTPDITVPVKGSSSTDIFLASLNGFTGPVGLSVSGMPTGVSVTLSTPFINLSSGVTTPTTLTVVTSGGVPAGDFSLTITAASGPTIHLTTVRVHVTDFSLSVTPTSLAIRRGNSATISITVTSLNGFAQPVLLSVSGLPTGVTASLTSSTVTGTGTSTLTLTISNKPAFGTFTILITGTSGSLVRIATVMLTVTK